MTTLAGGATVLVREDGAAARLTLNRAEKRDALMQELVRAPRRMSAEPGVRGIVIEAAGPAFSAGHDLVEMIGRDVPFYQRLFEVCTPPTVGIGKEAFYSQVERDEHRAYDLTNAVTAMNARADEAQERMCAFLEKREPTWRGR
jgi:enoyl-CoA hydratase/carnithine racemase